MSAPPVKRNLIVYKGASFVVRFVWRSGEPPALVNLSGYAARMQIREKVDAPTVLIELTTANGRIAPLGADGVIQLTLTAAETAAIAWKKGVYDLLMTAPDSSVRRLLTGGIAVSPGVTR